MPKRTLAAFYLLLICTAGKAQNFPSDSTLTRIFQSDALLPYLIDSAVKNSPDIKRSAKSVAMYEQNYRTSKLTLLNSLMLTSNYGYGNVGNLNSEKDPAGVNQAVYSNLKSSHYNVGFTMVLPLSSLLSRKNTSRAAEMQIQMAEEEKAGVALFIKQEVIKVYQALKLSHMLMLTSAKTRQVLTMSLNMEQKNFLDGQVTVGQLSKLQNEVNAAAMEYDTQVNKFQTAFLLLEAYTGVQLTNLIRRLR